MPINLRVQNFRCHKDIAVEFSDGLNIITGNNGVGKTSLIEALYIAYIGKSWRSDFSEIIRHTENPDHAWWRIDIMNSDLPEQRTVKYIDNQKEFLINQISYKRLPKQNHVPVVIFEPSDMQMLYGSPSGRRQFIDRFIAQIDPSYKTILNKFEKIVRQRNKLLKEDIINPAELSAWNEFFCDFSYRVSNKRNQTIELINRRLRDKYSQVAGYSANATIKLKSNSLDSPGELMKMLIGAGKLDIIGAQKDDLIIKLDGSSSKITASRGENRTIVFSLIATMVELARVIHGDKVIVLLDDIDSELDHIHRKNLYDLPAWQINTFATTLSYDGGAAHHINLS